MNNQNWTCLGEGSAISHHRCRCWLTYVYDEWKIGELKYDKNIWTATSSHTVLFNYQPSKMFFPPTFHQNLHSFSCLFVNSSKLFLCSIVFIFFNIFLSSSKLIENSLENVRVHVSILRFFLLINTYILKDF